MPSISFKWNDGEVRRKIERLEDAAKADVLESALMAGAQIIVNRAKQMAPVETGRLRDSITAEPFSGSSNAAVLVGADIRAVPYAPYVEFGTRRMRAQPYLRPAIEDSKDAIADAIGKAVMAALR